MDILHPQVDDGRQDQAHQIKQHRRRLAAKGIGEETEAREPDQGAQILD
jgi:hypothetical protein